MIALAGMTAAQWNAAISLTILSNEPVRKEYDRLRFAGGALEGPVCRACGARYPERPDGVIFNRRHEKPEAGGNRRKAKPSGFRIIHRPRNGKAGAGVSVFLDHPAQKEPTSSRCLP